MRNKIMAAAAAVALVVGLIALVKDGDPSSPSVEPSVPVNPLSVRRESKFRARAVEEMPSASTVSETNDLVATNLYARLVNGDFPKVSLEQLEPYFAKNGRNVDALLGALRASDDDSLLREAKERFPDDPRVQFAAAFKADSPEERQQWLEKFKQSDPDNALASYLLAGEHWKAGQTDQALQELTAAAGKGRLENYLVDFIQNAEEAYRAAGLSDGEAKAVAGMSALLPELGKLRQVGRDAVELAKRYQQAGDESSAQAVLQMGLDLGHRFDQSPQTTLIQELVGIAVERHVLTAMNPNAAYGETGQTVQDQINALDARRKTYKELTAKSEPIVRSMSDQELAHYFDRVKLYGDVAARRWVLNRAPQP
jgi:tetratricopeptide (TPR) repeat protein